MASVYVMHRRNQRQFELSQRQILSLLRGYAVNLQGEDLLWLIESDGNIIAVDMSNDRDIVISSTGDYALAENITPEYMAKYITASSFVVLGTLEVAERSISGRPGEKTQFDINIAMHVGGTLGERPNHDAAK